MQESQLTVSCRV